MADENQTTEVSKEEVACAMQNALGFVQASSAWSEEDRKSARMFAKYVAAQLGIEGFANEQ